MKPKLTNVRKFLAWCNENDIFLTHYADEGCFEISACDRLEEVLEDYAKNRTYREKDAEWEDNE